MTNPAIKGTIIIEGDAPVFAGAVLHVRLLDVTALDAPAETIAEQTVPAVTHAHGERLVLPFALAHPRLEPGHDYTIRAHLDRDGSGEVASGDLVSVQSYPVRAEEAAPQPLAVRLRPVSG